MSDQFEYSPRPVIQTTRIGGNVEWLEEEGMGGRAMQVDPGIVLSVSCGAHGGAVGERERCRLSYRDGLTAPNVRKYQRPRLISSKERFVRGSRLGQGVLAAETILTTRVLHQVLEEKHGIWTKYSHLTAQKCMYDAMVSTNHLFGVLGTARTLLVEQSQLQRVTFVSHFQLALGVHD